MFEATYLGWQGWLLASARTRLLVDPLLLDEVGHGPRSKRLKFHFWPPRTFDFSRFPAVDAVLLTHEHEDHFNPATLARIDRATPIWLSSRASRAARTLLHEMGFSVRLVSPRETLRLGDLEVEVFGPDHVAALSTDEWDTLMYAVRDEGRSGAFFTNVDVDLTDAAAAVVDQWSGPEGTQVLLFEGMAVELAPAARARRGMGASEMHAPPPEADFCEATSVSALGRGARLRPVPGQTFAFESGALTAIRQAPFLGVPRRPDWPERPRFRRKVTDPLEPFCGVKTFDDAAWPELTEGLTRLAEHLYGHYLFRTLYSLDERTLGGRAPTFAWILRLDDEGGACALAYDPRSCAFESIEMPEDPSDLRYVGVATSWATDLLGLFRGEFEGRAITASFHEAWHESCARVRLLSDVLWSYFHPLRHPEAALRRYRAAIADEAGAPVCVPAARGAREGAR